MKYQFDIIIKDRRYGGAGMQLTGKTDSALGVDVAYSNFMEGHDSRAGLEVRIQEDGKDITIEDIRTELRKQAEAALKTPEAD